MSELIWAESYQRLSLKQKKLPERAAYIFEH